MRSWRKALASGERLRRGMRRLDATLSNDPRKNLFSPVRGRIARLEKTFGRQQAGQRSAAIGYVQNWEA